MALKIPGISKRIIGLWEAERRRLGDKISVNKFCQKEQLSQQSFEKWTDPVHPSQPDYPGLVRLAEVFAVPVEWLIVGDAVANPGEYGLKALTLEEAARLLDIESPHTLAAWLRRYWDQETVDAWRHHKKPLPEIAIRLWLTLGKPEAAAFRKKREEADRRRQQRATAPEVAARVKRA